MQRFWHDVPTLMISFGYPYYLYDAPRVPAYVNAYGSSEPLQAAGGRGADGPPALRGHQSGRPFNGQRPRADTEVAINAPQPPGKRPIWQLSPSPCGEGSRGTLLQLRLDQEAAAVGRGDAKPFLAAVAARCASAPRRRRGRSARPCGRNRRVRRPSPSRMSEMTVAAAAGRLWRPGHLSVTLITTTSPSLSAEIHAEPGARRGLSTAPRVSRSSRMGGKQVDRHDHVDIRATSPSRVICSRSEPTPSSLPSGVDQRRATPGGMRRSDEDGFVEQVFPVAGEFLLGDDGSSAPLRPVPSAKDRRTRRASVRGATRRIQAPAGRGRPSPARGRSRWSGSYGRPHGRRTTLIRPGVVSQTSSASVIR